MTEERRAVPKPQELPPEEPPPSSTTEMPALSADSSPDVTQQRAPVVAGLTDDRPSQPAPSVRQTGGTRRRGRMALRIPDDEVSRPKLAKSEPPPPVDPPPLVDAVVVTPMRIIAINPSDDFVSEPPPPAVEPSAPAELGAEDSWTPFQPTVTDGADGPPASVSGRSSSPPSDDLIPIEAEPVAEIEAAPVSELSPDAIEPIDEPRLVPPPRRPPPAAKNGPSVPEPEGEDVRFEDDPVPAAPPPSVERGPVSDPAAELAPEDVLAVETASPEVPVTQLPPMRSTVASQPSAPPPPKKAATAPGKPPLVIVPPHAGVVAPQSLEGAAARRKGRLWWEDLFNDDYLRACEKLTDDQIGREVDFIEDSLSIEKGGTMLDLGCGTGRHAIELAKRGYEVVGFDLSLAMLARAGDEAQDRSAKLNFIQGDMREMTFEEQFDGVYCWNTTFGYFEEDRNAQVIDRIRTALKAEGLLVLDVVNRDFIIRQSPSLAWFEGDGCVCMDEMAVDFITSRLKVKRTIMLDDGRSREIEYSVRIYSLHELGKILHEHGFKVCEVSGRVATPGVFFGNESPRTLILAEKR